MDIFGNSFAIIKTAWQSAMADVAGLAIFCFSCFTIVLAIFMQMTQLIHKIPYRTRDRSEGKTDSIEGVGYEPDIRFR